MQFCGDSIPVEKLDAGSFEKIDIAFFSAGGDVSRKYVPIACQADAIAIDKSSAFRMDPHVPLVIPEINAEDVKLHRGILANPNCTTTVMLMALYPLHKIFRVHRVFAATYQAVSGSGTRGVEELTRQTKTWAEDSNVVAVALWATAIPRNELERFADNEAGYSFSAPDRLQLAATCRFVPGERLHQRRSKNAG